MAALTVSTPTQPYDSGRLGRGVYTVLASGAGADQTEIVAAVAGSYILILRGWISWDGGASELVAIQSASTTLFSQGIGAAFPSCREIPRGLYTAAGEALNLDKSGAVAVISCHIEYVYVTAGQHMALAS